jgi:hypothetical protein
MIGFLTPGFHPRLLTFAPFRVTPSTIVSSVYSVLSVVKILYIMSILSKNLRALAPSADNKQEIMTIIIIFGLKKIPLRALVTQN